MSSVLELINQINKERTKENSYDTKNRKDEILVMKEMLNDPTYEVTVYGNSGPKGTFNPSKAVRKTLGNIMAGASGMSPKEARMLMDQYEFKTSDARTLVELSKEFVNTYLQTGRKLPLGGRERSNVALVKRTAEPKQATFPVKDGVDKDGNPSYTLQHTTIPGYDYIKAYSGCPKWLKNDEEK